MNPKLNKDSRALWCSISRNAEQLYRTAVMGEEAEGKALDLKSPSVF